MSWLSAYFLQYSYNVFSLYTFLMAGSAVLLGGWLDEYAEVMLADLELAAELYFDFRSDGDPAKLLLSLYHAQQGVEKSFKLVAVGMGLFEEEKLKEELGHYPVINTLRLLIEEKGI